MQTLYTFSIPLYYLSSPSIPLPPLLPLLLSPLCHSNFTQTALEIYNTASVTIINSTFTDNICKGQRRVPNSGNAGAVSIGYSETYTHKHSPLIEVMNCIFTGNEANLEGDACGRANVAISQQIFTQRGGGLGCYFSAPGLEVLSNACVCCVLISEWGLLYIHHFCCHLLCLCVLSLAIPSLPFSLKYISLTVCLKTTQQRTVEEGYT